jgi:hypothetical protein
MVDSVLKAIKHFPKLLCEPFLQTLCSHQSVERSGPKLEQVPKDEQFKLDKRYDFGQYTITSVLTALLSDPRALFLKLASSFR